MYALSQREKMEAIILYPTMDAEAREARIEINDPMRSSNRAHVILRPVNLLKLDQFIAEERNIRPSMSRGGLKSLRRAKVVKKRVQ